MITTRHEPHACPGCGTLNDSATAADGTGSAPEPGDVAVCFKCGQALQYGEGLRLEDLDWSRLDQQTSAMILRAQNAALDSKGRH